MCITTLMDDCSMRGKSYKEKALGTNQGLFHLCFWETQEQQF
jgi:hypothetical protein